MNSSFDSGLAGISTGTSIIYTGSG